MIEYNCPDCSFVRLDVEIETAAKCPNCGGLLNIEEEIA